MRTTILPTSVIDLEAQTKNKNKRKKGEGNFDDSSRKVMSHHPRETCLMVYELFLRSATHVFDPFAGFGQRHFYAKQYGKFYTGYDISKANIDQAKKEYGVTNIHADSMAKELPEGFDAVYTCPPYFNLEVYEGEEGLDKSINWEAFLKRYEYLIWRIVNHAPKGTKFCFQVGDWRKKKKYYDLTYQTEKIFEKCGLTPVDKVILSRKKVSKIKVMAPQALKMGYTVKVHETLLIYEK